MPATRCALKERLLHSVMSESWILFPKGTNSAQPPSLLAVRLHKAVTHLASLALGKIEKFRKKSTNIRRLLPSGKSQSSGQLRYFILFLWSLFAGHRVGLSFYLVILYFVSILQRDSGYIANEKTHDLQYGLSLLLISVANFGEEFLGILCQINLLMFP